MNEFYSEIRVVHIAAAIASGSLFLLRGVALTAGSVWAIGTPLRILSYSIDTILLTAALMLMTIVQQSPFSDGWLTVKVVLLIVYLALGSLALNLMRPRAVRLGCFLTAILVYGFMISVARAHHPLGFLTDLFGA